LKHITVLDSQTGGFVIGDSAATNYDESLMTALNVIFDPDGNTSATTGFAGRDWAEVVEEAREAAKGIVGGRLVVVIAAEGFLYVTVQDEPLTLTQRERVRETKRTRLSIASGTLTVADGMIFFDQDGRDAYEAEDVPFANGQYDVAVHSLFPDPEVVPTVGVFGDDESPAVIVELTKSEAAGDGPVDSRVDMSHWTLAPVTGAICGVTVTRVNRDEAEGDVHLTAHVTSGKARFTVPEGTTLSVGEDCWVLLEHEKGKYWSASLIEHEG